MSTLDAQSPPLALRFEAGPMLLVAAALLAAIAVVDWAIGADYDLVAFYLAPVYLLTWRFGMRAGLVASLVAAAAWALGEAAGGHPYATAPHLVWNAVLLFATFAAYAYTLSRLREVLAREAAHARLDSLTGLLNRRAFSEAAAAELDRARRSGRPVALMLFDCDGFKRLNDVSGHAAGDAALSAVGAVLREQSRAYDLKARVGGDEFVVLFPDTGGEEATAAARALCAALDARMTSDGFPIRFSAGLAAAASAGSVDAALARADHLMYEAKAAGGGRVVSER